MLALSLHAHVPALTHALVEAALDQALRSLSYEGEAVRVADEAAPLDVAFHLALHPAASPLVFTLQGSTLALEAATGTAGPGYHAFVVTLAEAVLAALSPRASWKASLDPALYFAHRDFAALERAQEAWLKETATQIATLATQGASGFALCLPAGLEVAHGAFIATNLGPRDRAWVEAVSRDPAKGRDAFPWWDQARDAAFHLGFAKSLMWLDVRWRKPIDESERNILLRVVKELELAFAEDSTAVYPWHEWAEIFVLLGEESLRATRAQMKSLGMPKGAPQDALGYRRLAVRVLLSGYWTIAIPGDFAERWEDRGTWVGWDAKRTLWITTAEAPEGHDTEASLAGLPELEGDTDILAMTRGPIRGQVRFSVKTDENGVKSHIAHAHAALGRHVAIGTFIGTREDEREMFLEIWGSLDHDPS